MIILDYGRDLGCIPVFDVVSVSGTPTLRAIYSEGQPFLLPSGDGAAPSGGGVTGGRVGNLSFVGNLGGGDLSRVNDYPLQGPRLIVHRLIQGGERWQAITLAAPGSLTLQQVGIRSKTFHPPGRRWASTSSRAHGTQSRPWFPARPSTLIWTANWF
jgi:alpha-L-rhamnosidase